MIIKELTLNDTVELMDSSDYKERFCAEYIQTKIRYEKLKSFNTKIEAVCRSERLKNAVGMPKHDCPSDLLCEQQNIMGQYLHLLEVRAVIEGIDLDVAIKNCAMRVSETSGVCVGVYGPEVKHCSCAAETEAK